MSRAAVDRTRSSQIFRRAQELMPGGVNSPARAFGGVGGEPIVIAHADGPYLFDVDGNRYVDFIGSWGPMILGHRFPAVEQAAIEAVRRGTSYGAPTEGENLLAELIIDAVPSIEMVRLVNSGTEATMSAIRLARGFTGRDKIIKFAGNYHGHADSLLVAAGSAAATLGAPNSPGVTAGASRDTIVVRYNDLDHVKQAFEAFPGQIACVILEPVVGNMGCVLPEPGFLEGLRELTQREGTVLLFDEVMTGFRVAYGGVQERTGITPDLTTLGKIVGGGFPLAAYGGRREIMQRVLPAGKVFQAGTLSGNPVAVAAGRATLTALKKDPPYERLEAISARLAEALDQAATNRGLPHSVARMGSMMTLFFGTDAKVTHWDVAATLDTAAYARFFWSMMDRGVYLPCSQYEALFVSDALSEDDVAFTVAAIEEAMREV
ncbi:MAG TPA: glutamate-1-semialdehyde 2,1-aminomutase [Pirellulaceae bacterium]|jgi:glutamate-1-semialdehyde 2,1-aminomutase|nr:glutamate-1-semialdehyde 2,1-aminomutase [Pirellulaceae bacterium]